MYVAFRWVIGLILQLPRDSNLNLLIGSCQSHESGPRTSEHRWEWMGPAESTDEELALSVIDGNLEAYDVLVGRYQETFWRFLLKFSPNESELQDLVQEALIRVYRHLPGWQATGPFKGWALTVALSAGYDHIRKLRRKPLTNRTWEPIEDEIEKLMGEADPFESHLPHPIAELIERLLSELRAEDRLLITLHYYDEVSLPEIATRLGWGLSKVKVRLFRARRRLESMLGEYGLESALV